MHRGAYKWVPYHQYIQIGGTVPLALVGFFLAVSSVVMRGGKSFQGTHEVSSGIIIECERRHADNS